MKLSCWRYWRQPWNWWYSFTWVTLNLINLVLLGRQIYFHRIIKSHGLFKWANIGEVSVSINIAFVFIITFNNLWANKLWDSNILFSFSHLLYHLNHTEIISFNMRLIKIWVFLLDRLCWFPLEKGMFWTKSLSEVS